MSQVATITSKKQLTLPAELFKRVGFRIGEKVLVTEENGSLKITSAEKLVEQLAGSVPVPKEWAGRSLDEVIEEAKQQYFKHKYNL